MKSKYWIVGILIFATLQLSAQISKVNLQASGLTCSMCSNAINKSLKSIPFVENVTANIKNSSFEITFRPNASIELDLIKKKVEDAGFFVAKFEVVLMVHSLAVSNDAHIDINGTMFHFLHTDNKLVEGETTFRVIDKGYVSAKEYRKNAVYTNMNCYKTGLMDSCCNTKIKSTGTRIYHVTI